MPAQTLEHLECEIKLLERDRRVEEIKQIRSGRRVKWVTPAALASLLPIIGLSIVWTIGEIKEYGEGYQALKQKDELAKEKLQLQAEKTALNSDIRTLIAQKNDYASDADRQKRFFWHFRG